MLAGVLQLAKALEPRSCRHQLYLKAAPALAGSVAWGKADYMLKYRAIGIVVVQVITYVQKRQRSRSSSRTRGGRSVRITAVSAAAAGADT